MSISEKKKMLDKVADFREVAYSNIRDATRRINDQYDWLVDGMESSDQRVWMAQSQRCLEEVVDLLEAAESCMIDEE